MTFETAQDLLKCLGSFKSNVNVSGLRSDRPLGCLTKIVRIKNSFKNLPKLSDIDINQTNNNSINMSQFTYADVKVNVLIECRGTKMIGEIQFLLNWMLKAKKLGHTLYGFSRNKEYMVQLSHLFYNNHSKNNKESFSQELRAMIITQNFEKLEKMLLFDSDDKLKQLKQFEFEKHLIEHKWTKGLQLYQATLKKHSK